MPHPLEALRAAEIAQVSAACKVQAKQLGLGALKFLTVSLKVGTPVTYAHSVNSSPTTAVLFLLYCSF